MKASVFLLFIFALHIKHSWATCPGPNSSKEISKSFLQDPPGETRLPLFARSSSLRTSASSPIMSELEFSEPSSSLDLQSSLSPTLTPSPKPQQLFDSELPHGGTFLGLVGGENNAFRYKCLSCCKRFRDQLVSSHSVRNSCFSCWLSMDALNRPIPLPNCRRGYSLGYTTSPTQCFFQRCQQALGRYPWRLNCNCSRRSYDWRN